MTFRLAPRAEAAVLHRADAEAGDATGGLAALVAIVGAAALEAEGRGAHRAPAEWLGQADAARGADRVVWDARSLSVHHPAIV